MKQTTATFTTRHFAARNLAPCHPALLRFPSASPSDPLNGILHGFLALCLAACVLLAGFRTLPGNPFADKPGDTAASSTVRPGALVKLPSTGRAFPSIALKAF